MLLNVVAKSRRVISETGLACLQRNASLDKALIQRASEQDIPVGALETVEYQRSIAQELMKQEAEFSSEAPQVIACLQHHSINADYFVAELAYAYFIGNENEILHYINGDTTAEVKVRTKRNIQWLRNPITGEESLIKQLRASSLDMAAVKKPISIVIGIAHCLGSTGIIRLLHDRNFTLIREEDLSNLSFGFIS